MGTQDNNLYIYIFIIILAFLRTRGVVTTSLAIGAFPGREWHSFVRTPSLRIGNKILRGSFTVEAVVSPLLTASICIIPIVSAGAIGDSSGFLGLEPSLVLHIRWLGP